MSQLKQSSVLKLSSAVVALSGLTTLLPPSFRSQSRLLMGALSLALAKPIYQRSFEAFLKKEIKVDMLDSAIITASLLHKKVGTAAFMIAILGVAQMLLKQTSRRSRKSLEHLLWKSSHSAYLLKRGKPQITPMKNLKKGDRIIAYPGRSIPVDGVVETGEGLVDQSLLTGEANPIEKVRGDKVYASTLLLSGKLIVKVLKKQDQTLEAKIKQLIVGASEFKPKFQQSAEKLADRAVLPTFELAALAWLLQGRSSAMAVLNSDLGTGIRIAAPIALLSSLTRAAKNKILIKKGSVLELLPKADVFLFDKTGTLTHEIPTVTRIVKLSSIDKKTVLSSAATAERRSSHPIAKAILKRAKKEKIKTINRKSIRYERGLGVSCIVNKIRIRVGSLRFMKKERVKITAKVAQTLKAINLKGMSTVLVAHNNRLIGFLELRPQHRKEVTSVIQKLRAHHIKPILTSGDSKVMVKRSAQLLGIKEYHAQMSPQDKAKLVRKFQKKGLKVVMVGDGINDAPALALADVSISLAGATHLAQDQSDIIFMDGDFTKFDILWTLCKELNKNLKQNFQFILALNGICILGSLLGLIKFKSSLLLNNIGNFGIALNANRAGSS